ncbi:Protein roadkill [Orchesella cincta]|uniref:Protein roadkill n=1 Tax=Orchesella cincta TaxID=48709 RepID=A0A1D2MBA0_ORCCI|nr:Protein roadkill [Orchesella cincta]
MGCQQLFKPQQACRSQIPSFRGAHKNNYGWQLSMNPSKKFDGLEYCSVYVSLVDYGKGQDCQLPGPVRATFQTSLLNADGRPVVETAGRLVVNDTLSIFCKVLVLGVKQKINKSAMPHWSPSAKQKNVSFKSSFARDFGKMFRDSIGTDVTILTSNATFQAHTFILKARSSVFAAMFNTNMTENETKTLVISDFDDVVVKGMLEHLYTGETDCMNEQAQDLLKIAEKYDLGGLKADCEFELGDKLDLENAGELLVLAQTHNAPDLKSRAMDFINGNKYKLLKTKSFQDALNLLMLPL